MRQLTKGQLRTLKILHVSSEDYTDETLAMFFAETDRGDWSKDAKGP